MPQKEYPMKSEWLTTASTLSKALPYLQRYDGATVVIKFGGHAMGSDAAMESFARDVVLMQQVGVNPVIVHGGGPMINDMLKRLDIQSDFVDGKRVTDAATMEVVEMVLSGRVNKRIVQAINAQGGRAVGLSGKDASLMTCDVADPKLGLVGKPRDIDPTVLNTLFEADMIPVIAPLGSGDAGETFNINGDTVAGAIAAALKADRLLLLTDVSGVKNAEGEILTELSPDTIKQLTASGVIAGGMIPKTETALEAILSNKVKKGDVIVIRYEGPRGGPGMREMLSPTSAIMGRGLGKEVALITDGRFSGGSHGFVVGHISPEAASGGPLAIVKNGDRIHIDAVKNELNLDLPAEEIARRLKEWKPSPCKEKRGVLAKYAKQVKSASEGAITDGD